MFQTGYLFGLYVKLYLEIDSFSTLISPPTIGWGTFLLVGQITIEVVDAGTMTKQSVVRGIFIVAGFMSPYAV